MKKIIRIIFLLILTITPALAFGATEIDLVKQTRKEEHEIAKNLGLSNGLYGYSENYEYRYDYWAENFLSMSQMIRDINQNKLELLEAKKFIIKNKYDEFKVINLIKNYVIYSQLDENYNSIIFALVKEKGKNYLNGSLLQGDYFMCLGIEEFINSKGQKVQILVFAKIV